MRNPELLIKNHVKECFSSFKKFMVTDEMPLYELIINKNTTNFSNTNVHASHNYDVKTDKHTLKVGMDFYNGKKDYILFHDLTHMYDVFNFSANNRYLYAYNRGYTEYHAAQIELLKLLGANSVQDKISFSLSDPIETVLGKTSTLEYILVNRDGARHNILEVDFPNSLESLSNTIGMMFNYFGRVSICRMYANDYDLYSNELEDMTVEQSFLGKTSSDIIALSTTHGFLDNNNIMKFAVLFKPIIEGLYKKYEKNFS